MKLRPETGRPPRLRSAEAMIGMEPEHQGFDLRQAVEKVRPEYEEFLHKVLKAFEQRRNEMNQNRLIENLYQIEILEQVLRSTVISPELKETLRQRLEQSVPPASNIGPGQRDGYLQILVAWKQLFPEREHLMADHIFQELSDAIANQANTGEALKEFSDLSMLRPDLRVTLPQTSLEEADLKALQTDIDLADPRMTGYLISTLTALKLLHPEQFSQLSNWESILTKLEKFKIIDGYITALSLVAILQDPESHVDEHGRLILHPLPRKTQSQTVPLPERDLH